MASLLLTYRKVDPGTYAPPQDWDGTPRSVVDFDAAEFQITAATGGPWTPKRSKDGGVTWDACQVRDQFNTFYSSVTTALVGKCLSMKGRGLVMLAPTNVGDSISAQLSAS